MTTSVDWWLACLSVLGAFAGGFLGVAVLVVLTRRPRGYPSTVWPDPAPGARGHVTIDQPTPPSERLVPSPPSAVTDEQWRDRRLWEDVTDHGGTPLHSPSAHRYPGPAHWLPSDCLAGNHPRCQRKGAV